MQDQSDTQLLRAFAERANEAAFREIVTRHTDFVYSAALRQVESSAIAADLAQSVFTDLARKAQPLAEKITGDSSLAGWLHRSTRYAALNHLRDTRRRRENERQAMEQLLTNSDSAALSRQSGATADDWEQIRPALDEALDSLADEDREALLLRYFKNCDFRAVGHLLGVSDDTAQKRVSRAVEKLREFFAKKKITVGAGSLGILISANAVQAAPAGIVAAISAAALAGTAVTTSTIIATTKTIAMTTLQKTLVTAALVAAAGAGIFEARQAAQLREQNQTLQQQQAPLAEQIQKLHRERDDATNRLASMAYENDSLKQHSIELLKLRNEITMLKRSQAAIQATAANSLSPGAETKSVADESGRELGAAVIRGNAGAFDKLLAESEAEHRSFGTNQIGLNEEQRRELSLKTFAPINAAFKVIEEAANNGSQPALDALARAVQSPEMRGIAVSSLGGLAGNGDAGALEILIHPEQYGALLSTTISALQPAADKGNQPAIDALAAVANNPKDRALWYGTAESLTKAAAAGNSVAIDALINMSSATNQSIQRAVAQGLRGAAANQNAKAAAALHSMGMQ